MKEYFFEIVLWGACNLDCSYCYQKDSPLYGREKVEQLKTAITSIARIEKIIQLMESLWEKDVEISVIIYWWEPFVHKKTLMHFIERFYNANIAHRGDVSVLSNGTIIDHEIFKLLNKYRCFIDCCGHIDDYDNINPDTIFGESHKEFLNIVNTQYDDLRIICHIVIAEKNIELLTMFLKYYQKNLDGHRVIIGFDYIDSNWENLVNLKKVITFLLSLERMLPQLPFTIKFEPLICKAGSFTTRHSSSAGLHILPNGDVFGCGHVSITKNTPKDRYEALRISELMDPDYLKNIHTYMTTAQNKIICEQDKYAPWFDCYLKREWIKKIWFFINKYMKKYT